MGCPSSVGRASAQGKRTICVLTGIRNFPGGISGKEPTNAGDIRDAVPIPGLGRSPGGGHGKSLQYSCLENPMDRGAWWPTIHRVTKSQTQLKWLSTHSTVIKSPFASASLRGLPFYVNYLLLLLWRLLCLHFTEEETEAQCILSKVIQQRNYRLRFQPTPL